MGCIRLTLYYVQRNRRVKVYFYQAVFLLTSCSTNAQIWLNFQNRGVFWQKKIFRKFLETYVIISLQGSDSRYFSNNFKNFLKWTKIQLQVSKSGVKRKKKKEKERENEKEKKKREREKDKERQKERKRKRKTKKKKEIKKK